MKITYRAIKIKDIFNGYLDNGDDGVFAYNGKLSIRPPYQREFVYEGKQQEEVIHTILKNFPLNIMYWVKTGEDTYEVLDGQQRTLSAMRFLTQQFLITLDGKKYYCNALPEDKYDTLMNYELMIYICEGEESEKLEWFKIVNIAGEELTEQELRNSVYTGAWLFEAKKIFSKTNCAAKKLSEKYIKGIPNRQELLEKALKGITEFQKLNDITEYMAKHKLDLDADELWQYFQDVIYWIEKIFPDYRSDMKGLDWCKFYNKYHYNSYNSVIMQKEVKRLHEDQDVTSKKGIYEYLLSKDKDPFAFRLLNLRTFDDRVKRTVYERQDGICPVCGQSFSFNEMEGDHIKPWSKGGETVPENCQMLCKECNAKKTDMY